MGRGCKICKVVTELDKTGRCRSCIEAKAATDAGMTYGKFQGKQYAKQMQQEEEERRIQEQALKKARERAAVRAAQEAEEERRALREKAKKLREQGEFVCLICAEPLHWPERKYHRGTCAEFAQREQARELYHKRKSQNL